MKRRKPFVIKFKHDIFINDKINQKFIKILLSMPYATLSIYHEKLYVHVLLRDCFASSFDLWVFSPNEIIVIPQQSTQAAIDRLTKHIFTHFAKGKITKYNANNYPYRYAL